MRKLKSLGLLTILLILCHGIRAQEIVWAKEVEFSESSGKSMKESASRILGKPDALPYGEPSEASFRMGSKNGFGRVVVNFGEALPANQIFILENYLPGRIHKVFAYDEKDKKHLLYEGGFKLAQPYRILRLSLEETDFLVRRVEVSVLSVYDEGMAEIDAIGISNSKEAGLAEQIAAQLDLYPEAMMVKSFHSSKKINLDVAINSKAAELKPIISTDGNTLYFSRQNHPENVGSIKDEQDIYVSKRVDKTWRKAKNLGTPLNNQYPNGVVAVTYDEKGMYIINEYPSDGSYKKGLSFSQFKDGTWQTPVSVKVKGLYNFSEFVDYSLSPQQDVMILAMKRLDSKGGLDLYVSFPEGEHTWSAPKNLGKVINTGEDDFAPFLAADGQTLYFSSYGHQGFGDADIFISRRLDDTWQNWSEPENLGPKINGSGFDGYFTIPASGPIAYMVSNEGSIERSRDIFEVIVDERFMPNQKKLYLLGQVLDAYSLQPIPADVQLSVKNEIKTQLSIEPEHGIFRHEIKHSQDLRLSASYPGYQTRELSPDLSVDFRDGVIVTNLLLEPEDQPQKEEITLSASSKATRGNRFRDYTGSVGLMTTSDQTNSEPSIQLSIKDESTGENLKAIIDEINGKQIPPQGEGTFLIPKNKDGKSLLINKEGYLSRMLSTKEMGGMDTAINFSLEKVQPGRNHPLELKFHKGTDVLLILPKDPIKELAATLRTNKNLFATIAYSNYSTSEEALDDRRLESIRYALVKEGIDQSRIHFQLENKKAPEDSVKSGGSYVYVLNLNQELVSNQD